VQAISDNIANSMASSITDPGELKQGRGDFSAKKRTPHLAAPFNPATRCHVRCHEPMTGCKSAARHMQGGAFFI